MCLLVLAWEAHPRFRLVVAANRDEFHARASEPLRAWDPPDRIIGGRDLQAGGAWLGVDRERRFGAVTNFRELQRAPSAAPTRGRLVPDFLRATADPAAYLADLEPHAGAYCGFNLLLADARSLWYASNRTRPFARALTPGIYALSNESLDTPWPKVRRVRAAFEQWLQQSPGSAQQLFALLADRTRVTVDAELPQTGLPAQWERVLSSPFVLDPQYGTRCSTVLLLERNAALYVAERRFDPWGEPAGTTELSVASGSWP
ncbi:MAG TPA: NRDE family protein [Steroidobacteraceae bacterium]